MIYIIYIFSTLSSYLNYKVLKIGLNLKSISLNWSSKCVTNLIDVNSFLFFFFYIVYWRNMLPHRSLLFPDSSRYTPFRRKVCWDVQRVNPSQVGRNRCHTACWGFPKRKNSWASRLVMPRESRYSANILRFRSSHRNKRMLLKKYGKYITSTLKKIYYIQNFFFI